MTEQPWDDVTCPACRLPPDRSGACPDCGQDLNPLLYLRARPALHYNRALTLAGNGADTEAVRLLGLALAEDPRLLEAHVALGKLHARAGHTADARGALDAAIALDPDHEPARRALAALDESERSAARAVTHRRRRRRSLLVAGLAVIALLAGLIALLGLRTDPRPSAGTFALTVRSGEVALAGTVPDEGTRGAIVAAARGASGGRTVADATVVEPGMSPADAPDGATVGSLIAAMTANWGERSLVVTGPRAVLAGSVPDPAEGARLLQTLGRLLPGTTVENQSVVDPDGTEDPVARLSRMVAAMRPITFGACNATLDEQDRSIVAAIAAALRGQRRIVVRIEGHEARSSGPTRPCSPTVPAELRAITSGTCAKPGQGGVPSLAAERACAMQDALAGAGATAIVQMADLGDTRPLTTREDSRRVQVSVIPAA